MRDVTSESDDEASRRAAEVATLRDLGLSEREAELVVADRRSRGATSAAPTTDGAATAVALAVAAGLTVHAVRLVAGVAGLDDGWLARNAVLLLVPGLVVLLGLRRRPGRRAWSGAVAALVLLAAAANAVPHVSGSDTELLAVLHLPVLGWGVVLAAHRWGRGDHPGGRIDAVRFTGEVAVLYVLMGLGGAILLGLASGLLAAIGLDVEPVIEWVLPAGAAGAVVIAGWLVETRPRLAGGVAPVLAQVFTPLFGAMIGTVLVAYAVVGPGEFDREVVALLDGLLVVVLALAVYGQAARPPGPDARWGDRLRLGAVGLALLLDLGVLGTMLARVGELGSTPNRLTALGWNVVLLVALGGTAVTLTRALRGRGPMAGVEAWQARMVPPLLVWSAVVAVVLPLLPAAGR